MVNSGSVKQMMPTGSEKESRLWNIVLHIFNRYQVDRHVSHCKIKFYAILSENTDSCGCQNFTVKKYGYNDITVRFFGYFIFHRLCSLP